MTEMIMSVATVMIGLCASLLSYKAILNSISNDR